MRLRHRFSSTDKRRVWSDHPFCALCGSNETCSLHHIYGCEGDNTGSIYNSIMLCYGCHRKADGHNSSETGDERRISYLAVSVRKCIGSGHPTSQRDRRFLEDIRPDLEKAKKIIMGCA